MISYLSKSIFPLFAYLLFVNGPLPGWTLNLSSSCSHPTSVPNANVHLLPKSTKTDKDGRYPAGTEATIDCYSGFHLKYNELKYILCNEHGEWISRIKHPVESICQRDTCGRPPNIDHGNYLSDKNRIKVAGRAVETYPLGAILKPSCESSYSLNCSHQCGRIICEADGNWSLKKGDLQAVCISVSEPLPIRTNSHDYDEEGDTCGRPPIIEHGYYTIEKNRFKQTSPAAESYPIRTVLHAACEKSFSLNCTRACGSIVCEPNGHWAPRDDKLIKACVAEPLLVRSNPNEYTNEGHGPESSMKHYLVLGIAIVCVLAVCILTVVLLRRPTFCKKSRGTSSSHGGGGGGGMGGGGGGGQDVPVIITSNSPASNFDSLPVAMNTGIFLPGAGYDLQDCHFQDSPLVGTSMFK